MSTDLQKPSDVAVPSFMSSEITGLEDTAQYIQPPFLKVVQKMSDSYTDEFNAGDVVLVPNRELVAPVHLNENGKPKSTGESFYFNPLFFYVEFVSLNPIGSGDVFRERSTDPTSALARKCKNPATWYEVNPEFPEDEKKRFRNSECLNFIGFVHGNRLGDSMLTAGLPCVMSFSRGSYTMGSAFLSTAKMRNGAPLFGCVFECQTVTKSSQGQDYYAIRASNPSNGVSPYITDQNLYEMQKTLYMELKKAHEQGLIKTEYDTVDAEVAAESSEF